MAVAKVISAQRDHQAGQSILWLLGAGKLPSIYRVVLEDVDHGFVGQDAAFPARLQGIFVSYSPASGAADEAEVITRVEEISKPAELFIEPCCAVCRAKGWVGVLAATMCLCGNAMSVAYLHCEVCAIQTRRCARCNGPFDEL